MKCYDDHKYKMAKDHDDSCNLTFTANKETFGTYRNTDFHEDHRSKSVEVKLLGE